MYSKIMANSVISKTVDCDTYRPFIMDEEDFAKYNIIKT
jgi:hypothetical protein